MFELIILATKMKKYVLKIDFVLGYGISFTNQKYYKIAMTYA